MKRARTALNGGAVNLVASRDYRAWINDLRKQYGAAQTKAAVSVNSALLEFYWNLGKDISEKRGGEAFTLVEKFLHDLPVRERDENGHAPRFWYERGIHDGEYDLDEDGRLLSLRIIMISARKQWAD